MIDKLSPLIQEWIKHDTVRIMSTKLCSENYVGIRMSIFFSGCDNYCKGCFNKETWNWDNGEEWTLERLFEECTKYEFADVSILGGDCLYHKNVEATESLVWLLKEYTDKHITIYTGSIWEDIIQDEAKFNAIQYADILIDGKYDENLKDRTLAFRGSSNQRIIDIQQSIKEERIIEVQL